MKTVCLFCERTTLDSNLWCQESYCPAEASPTILDYGEWLGDIEIIRSVIVLRSAVLYEAMHNDQKVFLKVAHPGDFNREKLKREADFLLAVKNRKSSHMLPDLLPAFANTNVADYPYGKAMLRGQMLYFFMFEFVDGEPLRDLLLKNPQLWFKHVGWIMVSLSSVLTFLHDSGRFHLCLSPEVVLVRFDKENIPRILLYDLGVTSGSKTVNQHWSPMFVAPAYTAPELINQPEIKPVQASDVYGLGLLLYEMLIGEPAFDFKLRSDAEVYRSVLRKRIEPMDRTDLTGLPELAELAVSQRYPKRPQTVTDFVKELFKHVEDVPKEPNRREVTMQTLSVAIGALLAIAFLIALAISLADVAL